MAGLRTIQIGRQWCGLAAIPNSTGADRQGMRKAAQNASVSRHSHTRISSSLKTGIERAAGDKQGSGGQETVTVSFRGNEITVPRGTVLRSALLQNGLTPHNDAAVVLNCRGTAHCGTCAVQVEGKVQPPTWGGKENWRLNTFPHHDPENSNLRLACQVRLEGDVTVTKYGGAFGEGSNPLGPTSPSDSVKPLGPLEFFFDFEKKGEAI